MIKVFLLISLATLSYVVANPWWYGDAIWYATEIALPEPFLFEAGHLFWRPLGMLLWALSGFPSGVLAPLLSFQVVSGLFAASGVVLFYGLARRLSVEPSVAVYGSMFFAGSHFLLAYGGSGSSYSAALTAMIASFYFALDQRHSVRLYGALLSFVLAWGFWAVSALCVLGVATAFAFTEGKHFLRKTILFCALAGTSCVAIALLSYLSLHLEASSLQGFFEWLRSSSHGIPGGFSLSNTLRAVLGVFITHLFLFDLGAVLKNALHTHSVSGFGTEHGIALVACLLFSLTLAVSFIRILTHPTANRQRALIVSLTTITPIFFFAFFWQGSDVERLCYLLPITSLCITVGLSRGVPKSVLPILVLVFVGYNLSTRILPPLFDGGGTTGALTRFAQEKTSSQSLIVVHGQGITTAAWVTAQYLSGRAFHSLLYEAQVNGDDGWENRLGQAVEGTQELWVLEPLVSTQRSTEALDKLRLNPEYPVPSLEQTREYFKEFEIQESYDVSGFTFVKLLPHQMFITNS